MRPDLLWRHVIVPLPKHAAVWVVILITVFPVYFGLITSLKTKDEYLYNKVLPSAAPTVDNFARVLTDPRFFVWARNSGLLTLTSCAISLVVCVLAAFAFSQLAFFGKKLLLQGLVSLLILPTIVLAIPLFVMFAQLKAINTLPTLVVIYVGILSPFTLYILNGFFKTVPGEILDAAYMDGCSKLRLLWYVLLPLVMPALISVTLVNALFVWNEILMAVIFLQGDNVRTMMAGVTGQSRFGALDVPFVMAGLVLASVPMIVLYVVSQQYFIRGLTAGGLKG